MAKTKAELMAEKLKKQQVGKTAFQTGKKPVAEVQTPVTEIVPVEEPAEDLSGYVVPANTQGRKGMKTPRMNLAIPEDVYEYIRRESKKQGMTYSEYICAVMRQRQQMEAQ